VAEHPELALMVEAGLTPAEAIMIATSGAAALLGLEDRGALVPGRLADLIVLDTDLTVNIAATTRIVAVWHRGQRVAPVPTRSSRVH
jgi:imidazolonepropionase-like amidohydrolase